MGHRTRDLEAKADGTDGDELLFGRYLGRQPSPSAEALLRPTQVDAGLVIFRLCV
jgi:hypothetical protein